MRFSRPLRSFLSRPTPSSILRGSALLSLLALSLPTLLLVTAGAPPASAAEPAIFRMADRDSVLEGEREGVSVDPEGRMRLSPRLERVTGLDEPFVFSASALGEAVIVGTGNEGRVFRVGADGEAELLATLPEPEIFAVLGRGDGSVLAASSPDGRVSRLDGDAVETVFDPEATYIWALAEDADGHLLVATGLPGQLWRVDGDGNGELLFESPDRHVRTLLPRADGSILVGTAGQGLVVEVGKDGVRTLYDGAEPEVLAFAVEGEDGENPGTVYAALLASEASFVDLSTGEEEGEGDDSGALTIGSRSGGFEGPRSVLVALESTPEMGGRAQVHRLAQLDDQTVHDLAWADGRLWVATGQEGRLFSLQTQASARKGVLVREAELDELQLVALEPLAGDGSGGGAAVVTTNAGAVYRLHRQLRAEGTVSSPVLDAGALARFGNLRWRGHLPAGSGVEWRVRSGMASEPDATWSDWQALPSAGSASGRLDRELALADLGTGRYLQWQARLRAASKARSIDAASPVIEAVEISYRQVNRPPQIAGLEVLDPGQVLVAQNFNPTSTTFEPWSPNRDGIFTTLRQEKENQQQKELWKKGYRTLRWEAVDPNGDSLRYALEVLAANADGTAGSDGAAWLPVVDDLEDNWYSFDSTVLPDGLYRFRLRVSDGEGNPPEDALETLETSGWVTIDHTPPRVSGVRKVDGGFEVTVADGLEPLRDAVYSVDAGAWRPATVGDGLLDGRRETLRVPVPADARLVLLRLTDAAHNVVTSRLDSP